MGKLAYIFPGQGSQSIGMGKSLAEGFAVARESFEEADEALGFSLSGLCWNGDAEELALTENTQPAILACSVAAFRVLEGEGVRLPDFVAGHSLGEYSALVAAGVLDFSEALKTVKKRGRYMQEAVPKGEGAMAAILGASLEQVEEACAEAAEGEVCSPANINSPGQVVIAGNAKAIERACGIAKEKGAKRAIMLNVSAPFHCGLMMPAQNRLEADLKGLRYSDFRFPIVHNVDAGINSDPLKVTRALTEQVSLPVRWLRSMELLAENGVDTFIEAGNGKVLSGLIKQANREARCFNFENSEDLSSIKEAIL